MNFKIVACLLAVLVAVECQLPGGFHEVSDANSAIVNEASRLAKERLMGSNGICENGLHRTGAQQQVVNGMNYKFTYHLDPSQCGDNGAQQTCTVVVFVSRDQTEKTVRPPTCQ